MLHGRVDCCNFCYLVLLLMLGALAAPAQDANTASQTLTIPDGTPVELRFTETIRRRPAVNPSLRPSVPAANEVQPGDIVRLMVAANVRIEGRVVIAKDAITRARVTGGLGPGYTGQGNGESGLFLQLEPVPGINGIEIPLRAFKKSGQEPFYARIGKDNHGPIIRPAKIPSLAAHLPNFGDAPTFGESSVIPAGARITAFVHGPAQLDRQEVEQAQAQLPASGAAALVTIYRTKDGSPNRPSVTCDGERMAQIGEQQYAIWELPPGAHTCQTEGDKPTPIAVLAGEEYFLRLHPHGKNWELKRAEAAEAQAAMATAQMVTGSD